MNHVMMKTLKGSGEHNYVILSDLYYIKKAQQMYKP